MTSYLLSLAQITFIWFIAANIPGQQNLNTWWTSGNNVWLKKHRGDELELVMNLQRKSKKMSTCNEGQLTWHMVKIIQLPSNLMDQEICFRLLLIHIFYFMLFFLVLSSFLVSPVFVYTYFVVLPEFRWGKHYQLNWNINYIS